MPVISTIAAATARAFGAFKAAAGGAADEFFNYVTLLLHGDGTNGAQNNTFLDSSTNNFTITRNGNTTQGTFSPFSQDDGKWGAYFDGSANGFISTPATTDLNLDGNFTIQAWIYPTADSQANGSEIVSRGAPSTLNGWHFYYYNNKLNFGFNYSGFLGANTTTLSKNTWSHIAITRSGNTFTYYLNGVADGTFTSSATPTTNGSDVVYVGRGSYDTTNRQFPGYISNASIVKGTALTTFNTTTPLSSSTSNQSLLVCTSNRFRDANTATTAKTITASSGASIQPFSPFAPSAAYSAATNGGSGYFDGSGDYLSVPSNTAFAFGTGDFTVEGWVYYSSVASNAMRILATAGAASNVLVQINNSSQLEFYDGSTTVTFSGLTTQANAWNHIAVTRSGTSLRGYINGAQTGSTATNSANIVSTQAVNFPATTNYAATSGYISSVRYLKGTALYTGSTYTVPTAPLTAIANTSFLANFTNAGILDNTGRNDLETVGNAQISTSVKKFGTGSISIGASTDGCAIPSSANVDFGTGPWTIEGWFYTSQTGSTKQALVMNLNQTTGMGMSVSTSSVEFRSNGQTDISGSGISSNTWTHLAWVRNGNTVTIYKDGTSITSGTYSNAMGPSKFYVGPTGGQSGVSSSFAFNGYIDDLRITKGVARYTSNFTPPTAAFEDQ